ncbi:hypothetical protein [Paenibacillus antarcticus]|uniref:hypothetical protein n=1 Tax=Paenibacillus antarcticus TaxID=253703 RepID=UPI000A61A90D|nr:hypothetical protein [Paenibacillus antarcticus]
MTDARLMDRVKANARLQQLIKVRRDKKILDAGNDWLDKEISDLETFLHSKEGQAV